MSNVLHTLGRRVAEHRKAAGFSQQELADAVGLTRSSIANIEGGRQDTSVTRLVAIAEVLGVAPCDLLTSGSDATQDQLVLARTLNRMLADQVAAVRAAVSPNRSVEEVSAI